MVKLFVKYLHDKYKKTIILLLFHSHCFATMRNMSEEIHFITKDIANRLYTQTCDCSNLKQLGELVQIASREKNVVNYLQKRYNYVRAALNSLYLHTTESSVGWKPCQGKDFVLTNNLTKVLREHLFILELIKNEIKNDRPTQIVLSHSVSTLLDIFGYPPVNKSVELFKYIEVLSNFLQSTLDLQNLLVKTCGQAKPNSLHQHYKLELLTIILFSYYLTKIRKNGKPTTISTTTSN